MAGPITGTSSSIDPGVLGSNSSGGLGVWGISDAGNGILGSSGTGNGVVGQSGSGNAGQFNGKVSITGDLTVGGNVTANDVLLSGKDCAEEFESGESQALVPGSVVVFDQRGAVVETDAAYNTCVAGVISGAGLYRPAVVLGVDGAPGAKARVALIGRVYCKVDASYAKIEVGDLLTTSPTRGYAMKVTEPSRAFGAVIGKALASVNDGRDLIPVLVTLQ